MKAKPKDLPLLQRQLRRSRGTLLAWAAAAAIAALAWDQAVRLKQIELGGLWPLTAALASFALLLSWCFRVWALTPQALAREYDVRWGLKGRLEAAVELRGCETELARAQRDEVARTVAPLKPVGTWGWIAGWIAAGIALALLAGELGITLSAPPSSRRPEIASAAVTASSAAVKPAAPLAPAVSPASLQWKSPSPAIKAGARDTVPLIAEEKSARGLRALALEAAIGSLPARTFPVNPNPLSDYSAAGDWELRLNLYLDETGAKPGDTVSYRLVGNEVDATDAAQVASPRQIIRIELPPAAKNSETKLLHPNRAALKFTLPPRASTPAGRLESLAARQAEFNRTLQAAAGASPAPGLADRQAEITRGAQALAELNQLTPDVERLLRQAAGDLQQATRQVELGDLTAAKEPAAQAAATLQQAVQTQEAEGRAAAAQLLAQAQSDLNEARLQELQDLAAAAQSLNEAAKRDQVAQQLREEAQRQQQQGSAAAARALSEVAQQAKQPPPGGGQPSANGQAGSKPSGSNSSPPSSSGPQSSRSTASRAGSSGSSSSGESSSASSKSAEKPPGPLPPGQSNPSNSPRQEGKKIGAPRLAESGQGGTKSSGSNPTQSSQSGSGSFGVITPSSELPAFQIVGGGQRKSRSQSATDTGAGLDSPAAAAWAALDPAGAVPASLRQLADLAARLPHSKPGPDQASDLQRLELAAQVALHLSHHPGSSQLAGNLIRRVEALPGAADLSPTELAALAQQAGDLANELTDATAGQARDEWVRRFNPEEIDPDYRQPVQDYYEDLSRKDASR